MTEDEKNSAIANLFAKAKKNGAASMTVDDGHVLMLRKDKLKELLEERPDSEIIVVFAKTDMSSDGMTESSN